VRGITPTPVKYFRALDPRRSLSTAVAWLAVAVSLATAAALLAVGTFAMNSMLAQHDAAMQRYADHVAAALDHAYADAVAAWPASLGRAPDASVLVPATRLSAVVDAARPRARPDPGARVLLLDEHQRVVFEHEGAAATHDGPVVTYTAAGGSTPALRALGLHLAVVQPGDRRGRDGSLQEKLTAISILLGVGAALLGAAFARGLTRRLGDLTAQVQRVARQQSGGIVEPAGRDEVAILGRAFSRLLDALRRERDELDALTRELEARVQARTREVERLAADSRYAAVAHERLRLARDLHDTLAHSMMEMLVELRMLRTLQARDPQAVAAELERAEALARRGLQEARDAVSQMRMNAVRELGLASALGSAVNRFAERTGVAASFGACAKAAGWADARAEGVFRIAQEALRNIERHAGASCVDVRLADAGGDMVELAITDDGAGFDPDAPHPGHYGVTGIREQAELIDAELEIRSAPGVGCALRLRLSFAAAPVHEAPDLLARPAHG
jgi:signal transduction histidine kinase